MQNIGGKRLVIENVRDTAAKRENFNFDHVDSNVCSFLTDGEYSPIFKARSRSC
jgi:hypothetical protein